MSILEVILLLFRKRLLLAEKVFHLLFQPLLRVRYLPVHFAKFANHHVYDVILQLYLLVQLPLGILEELFGLVNFIRMGAEINIILVSEVVDHLLHLRPQVVYNRLYGLLYDDANFVGLHKVKQYGIPEPAFVVFARLIVFFSSMLLDGG